jgi:hypothetical protein
MEFTAPAFWSFYTFKYLRDILQQICRKCHIPLQRVDDHMANYKLKTVSEIKKLVENANLEGLKALSQTYLQNALEIWTNGGRNQ